MDALNAAAVNARIDFDWIYLHTHKRVIITQLHMKNEYIDSTKPISFCYTIWEHKHLHAWIASRLSCILALMYNNFN